MGGEREVTIIHRDDGEVVVMSQPVNGSDKFHAAVEVEMARGIQTGHIAQNNFVTVSKAQDYDYMEGKRIVSLEEAIGVREVSSRVSPGGPASSV